jgi:hypothetical protein
MLGVWNYVQIQQNKIITKADFDSSMKMFVIKIYDFFSGRPLLF